MKAVFIANARSRRGKEWFEQGREALQKAGIELVSATATREVLNIPEQITKWVTEGHKNIIVGGGDGTLSLVAGKLIRSDAALGVMPFGTGNQFARDLHIPADVAKAAEIIAGERHAMVDVAQANDRIFLNVATAGLTTRVAEELDVKTKRIYGRFVYAIALARALRKCEFFNVELTVDGERHDLRTLQIVIGNGRFHAGPFPVTPHASIRDGKLSMYAIKCDTKWALLKLALALPGGRHAKLDEVDTFSGKEVTLKATPVQEITVDGEICAKTPAHFKIIPNSLRVFVPGDFKSATRA